jgi:hypothetical protein
MYMGQKLLLMRWAGRLARVKRVYAPGHSATACDLQGGRAAWRMTYRATLRATLRAKTGRHGVNHGQ